MECVEGAYHQVKKMLGACGGAVETLHRESMGPLSLDTTELPEGASRLLTQAELELIKARRAYAHKPHTHKLCAALTLAHIHALTLPPMSTLTYVPTLTYVHTRACLCAVIRAVCHLTRGTR